MRLTKTGLILFLVAPVQASYAADCSNYPYTNGMNIEAVAGGTKIIATASVAVSINDVDSVNDARDEANITAKSIITKFFTEEVTSTDNIVKAVKETKSMQGDSKQVERKEVIERIKKLSNSSSALLRGVVPLGDCYTPGQEFRASVGVKPESIAAAGGVAGAIGRSMADQPGATGSTQQNNAPSIAAPPMPGSPQRPTPVPGYSNTDGVTKF